MDLGPQTQEGGGWAEKAGPVRSAALGPLTPTAPPGESVRVQGAFGGHAAQIWFYRCESEAQRRSTLVGSPSLGPLAEGSVLGRAPLPCAFVRPLRLCSRCRRFFLCLSSRFLFTSFPVPLSLCLLMFDCTSLHCGLRLCLSVLSHLCVPVLSLSPSLSISVTQEQSLSLLLSLPPTPSLFGGSVNSLK